MTEAYKEAVIKNIIRSAYRAIIHF